MGPMRRFVSLVEIDGDEAARAVGLSVLHQAQLDDGPLLVVLDDRGWSANQDWAMRAASEIRDTARMVVGPDEPLHGPSQADAVHGCWLFIQDIHASQDAAVPLGELQQLPRDVVFGPDFEKSLPLPASTEHLIPVLEAPCRLATGQPLLPGSGSRAQITRDPEPSTWHGRPICSPACLEIAP